MLPLVATGSTHLVYENGIAMDAEKEATDETLSVCDSRRSMDGAMGRDNGAEPIDYDAKNAKVFSG